MRFFYSTPRVLSDDGFTPDLPPEVSWTGQTSAVTGDYLVLTDQELVAAPGRVQWYEGEDVRAAGAARGIAGDPNDWQV